MFFGRSVIGWLVAAFIAVCLFFLAQWLIPLVFGLVGLAVPRNIVNILSLLIALGAVYGGWYRRAVV